MSETSLKSTGIFNGYFEPKNHASSYFKASSVTFDSDGKITALTSNPNCGARRQYSESITNESNSNVPMRRFYLSAKLQQGFCLAGKPLPKNCPVRLVFHRSLAKKALLGCVETEGGKLVDFPERFIPIQNPVLKAYYISSSYYDQKFTKATISRFRYDFLDFHVQKVYPH